MAREVVMIVKEERLGVPVSSPTIGEDAIYIKLSESNAFKMNPALNIGRLANGNGLNTTGCFYSATSTLTGTLSTELYHDTAKYLLDWALTPVNSDRNEPWDVAASGVGKFPVGDIASVSIYHGVYYDSSDTWVRRRCSGVKVTGGTLTASSQDQICKLSLNLSGVRDDTNAAGSGVLPNSTEFPINDSIVYPCDPYLFKESVVKINEVIENYGSINFSWTNTVNPTYFESTYPKVLRYAGRGDGALLQLSAELTDDPDYEAAYRSLASHDVELSFVKDTNNIKIDLNTNNIISTRDYNLPLDNLFLYDLTINNAIDASAGVDLTVSGT